MRPLGLALACLSCLAIAGSSGAARAQPVPVEEAPFGQPKEVAPLQVPGPPPPRREPPRNDDTLANVGIGVLVAFGAADVAFATYGAVVAAKGKRPDRGVAIAEAVTAAPQALVLGIMNGAISYDSHQPEDTIGVTMISAVPSALLIHGIWSAQLPPTRPGVLYGVPWATGFDGALTVAALSRAGKHRLIPRGAGVAEMLLTAPQIAASAYGIAKDPDNRVGWGFLAGWSSALFLHGVVSAASANGDREDDIAPPPPPPPPEPEPTRPPLLVPASLQLGPMPVDRGAGLALSGRWF